MKALLTGRNGALLLILFVSLGLRLMAIPVLHSGDYYTGDEKEYMYLATRLAAGYDFVDTNGEYSTRSPLYPYVLSGLIRAGGTGILLSHLVGAFLGVIAVVVGYVLAMRLFKDELWALAAAAVMGLYPGLVIYSALLQTEMLFIVLLLGSFVAGYSLLDKPGPYRGAILGILSGCAVLVRAVYLGFYPIFLATLFLARRDRWREYLPSVAVSVLVFLALNLPWLMRNYDLHDALVPVSLWGGRSMLVANNPFATGTWSNHPGFEEWFDQELAHRGYDNRSSMTEYQLSTISREIGIDYLKENPGRGLSLAVVRAHIFWIYPITNSDSNIPLQRVAVGADVILYSLLAIGLAASRKRWYSRLLPILASCIVFFLIHLVLQSEARYRLPIVPFLCLFAGIGLGVLVSRNGWRDLIAIPGNRIGLMAGGALLAAVYGYTGYLFLEGRI